MPDVVCVFGVPNSTGVQDLRLHSTHVNLLCLLADVRLLLCACRRGLADVCLLMCAC